MSTKLQITDPKQIVPIYSLSKIEKETSINFNESSDMATISTTSNVYMTKVKRLMVKHPDKVQVYALGVREVKAKNDAGKEIHVDSYQIIIPAKSVHVTLYEMTDEHKQRLGDHLKNFQNEKETKD